MEWGNVSSASQPADALCGYVGMWSWHDQVAAAPCQLSAMPLRRHAHCIGAEKQSHNQVRQTDSTAHLTS